MLREIIVNKVIHVRVSDDHYEYIARCAAAMRMSVSEYMRVIATRGKIVEADESKKAEEIAKAVNNISQIDRFSDLMVDIVEGFNNIATLLDNLIKTVDALALSLSHRNADKENRVVSFREFRARVIAEDMMQQRKDEDVFSFLLRIAQEYYKTYHVWPDISDQRKFGQIPQGFNIAKWPRNPVM